MTASSTSDVDRALQVFRALCVDSDELRMVTIEGAPKSKARARAGRHGFYQPDSPQQQALAWRLAEVFGRERLDGNVAVGAIFYRPNHQRIDADNMMKLVMDAATGVVWKDDCQVTAQMAIIELDAERPRTVLVFGRHASSLHRGAFTRKCARCQAEFAAPWSGSNQRFCSKECRGLAVKQHKPPSPRARWHQPPKPCLECGAQLSKRSYIRCRDCWKKSRSRYES